MLMAKNAHAFFSFSALALLPTLAPTTAWAQKGICISENKRFLLFFYLLWVLFLFVPTDLFFFSFHSHAYRVFHFVRWQRDSEVLSWAAIETKQKKNKLFENKVRSKNKMIRIPWLNINESYKSLGKMIEMENGGKWCADIIVGGVLPLFGYKASAVLSI